MESESLYDIPAGFVFKTSGKLIGLCGMSVMREPVACPRLFQRFSLPGKTDSLHPNTRNNPLTIRTRRINQVILSNCITGPVNEEGIAAGTKCFFTLVTG